MTDHPVLRLRKNQDRRVRAGHPWIFSNEIDAVEGEPPDGSIVDVIDSRGAYLGRGYVNRHSLIAARLLTRGRDEIDAAFFRKRIARAIAYREDVLPGATALRLVASEGDFLPGLTVDRYGDVLTVQITTLGMEARRELVRDALVGLLSPRAIVLRNDVPLRRLEGLPLETSVWHGAFEPPIEIEADGLRYRVDPLGGQKTGFFLDQRMNRRLVAGRVSNARVLDLFSYSGAWGMEALRQGASSALFLDGSEAAVSLARANAELNGLLDRTEFHVENVFDALPKLVEARERFDVVVLDPPALVKSRAKVREGLKGYRELNRRAMSLLPEGGWLFTCSCSFHVSPEDFLGVLAEASRDAHRPFRFIQWGAQSPDHPVLLAAPETSYLKCAVLRAV
ncbi:MAG: class I SAM-dependent rRNA methyltransferase [Candidatus Eiseniibacteriota bacterium]